jgi:AhpD family alkylhydroperoxidase
MEIKMRMRNPALVLPGAMEGVQALNKAKAEGGVPRSTLGFVHLRVSQINGCGVCVESGSRGLKAGDESDERIFAVAAWRETSHFSEAERAALALAEAVTRLSDGPDPVPDQLWEEVAKHYDEKGLAALILEIAIANMYNRFNVTTRQTGSWGGQQEQWQGKPGGWSEAEAAEWRRAQAARADSKKG